MVSRIKPRVVFYVVALYAIVAFLSHTAYAQGDAFVSGGQICQPMSSTTTGISWRSNGILNESDETRWVVCPVVFNKLFNTFDVTVDLVNGSDVVIPAGGYLCVLRINDLFGEAVSETDLENDEPADPGSSFSLAFSDFVALDTQSVSLSCQLPPGTGIVRVVHDVIPF